MSRSLAMEILSAIASSARNSRIHDEYAGPQAERDFEVGEFERIDLSGPFDVEIQTGAECKIRASGPERSLEEIRVELQGDCLTIGCDGDCSGDVLIAMSVPQLRSIRSAGSGDVGIDNVKGEEFECSCSGSGDLSIDSIDAEKLTLSSAGSGDVRIDKVRTGELEATSMGSGDLSLDAVEGSAFRLRLNGSGDALMEVYGGYSIGALVTGSGDLAV